MESNVDQRPIRTKLCQRIVPVGLWLSALVQFSLLENAMPAMSQELEPRSYSASPVDSNFAVGALSNSTGTVPLDPSLPLSDVRPAINTVVLSFTHTFRLGNRTANWAFNIPYLGGHVSAVVSGQPEAVSRYGFADFRARFGVNLLGRALTPAEFVHRKPSTTLGVSMTIIVPTGAYNRSEFINIGSNRWTFKPEIGLEQPLGKWFADLSAGVWVFGENTDYLGGQALRQAPLGIFQVHVGYVFRQNQWLALDANYYSGGATSVNGANSIDSLANSRCGLTFSQPVGSGLSAKLSWSRWLSGRFGQKFSTVAVALQYLWFNRR
ncbi:MAG: transporter [Candidatus Baltobacteraceae bacterium]